MAECNGRLFELSILAGNIKSMKIETLVTKDMYENYLDYKFNTTRLNPILKLPYKFSHYIKNILKNYYYPRAYVYNINELGITKFSGKEQHIYKWSAIGDLQEINQNVAFLKNEKLVLFVYSGDKTSELIRKAKGYLV